MKHLLLFCTLLLSIQSFGQGSLESDRLALIALYNSTDGVNWFEKAGWNAQSVPGTDPCGWYGVTCTGGRVTGLDLNLSGLNGDIPAQIAGGTMINNTYKWYQRSFVFGAPAVLVATVVGDNSYLPTEEGNYTVKVTNSVVLRLTLESSDYQVIK